MLGVLLTLLPGMRVWLPGASRLGELERNNEQFVLTSCTSTIKSHFPCPETIPQNSTCLCDQHLYLTTCLENHASYPPSHPDRVLIETTANEHCRAAGDITADRVRRIHEQQRRQIGSFISSIVGDVSSVLSSKGVTVPTAVIESVAESVLGALPTGGSVDATSIAAEVTASSRMGEGSSSVVVTIPAATGLVSSSESTPKTTQGSSSSTGIANPPSSSNSSSGPSTGLIAGVVVGGIAALALIGIFVLLLLRHRKKKSSKTASLADKEASPTMSSSTEYPQPPPTNSNNTFPARPLQTTYPPTATPQQSTTPSGTLQSPISPLAEGQQTPWSSSASPHTAVIASAPRYSSDNDEKPPQHHQFYDAKVPLGNEMPTQANVWEIGGREIPRPSELDAGKRDGLNLGDVGGGQRRQGESGSVGNEGDRNGQNRDGEDRRGGGVGVAL